MTNSHRFNSARSYYFREFIAEMNGFAPSWAECRAIWQKATAKARSWEARM